MVALIYQRRSIDDYRFNLAFGRTSALRRVSLRRDGEVLSVEEAARLLEAAPGTKYNATLGVANAAGRASPKSLISRADDIDSQRMLVGVENGKGGGDRKAMLSPQLLERLWLWWGEGKRRGVMFPHGTAPTREPSGVC